MSSSLPPRTVTVFLASTPGHRAVYAECARQVGHGLASRGVALVYGGASVGTMGMLADAALAAGGRVHGIIVQALVDREVAHQGLSSLTVVDTMQERKRRLAAAGDAFLVLPGGFGTLEEAFEVLTAAQLGWHQKPVVFVNVDGFYDALFAFLDHAASEGLLRPELRPLVLSAQSVEQAMQILFSAHAHRS